MPAETVEEALGTAMQAVLETMFFIMPDGELNPLAPLPSAQYQVEMTFSGACWGRFELRITTDAARSLAGNFTGVSDPAELPDEKILEVVSELTNMICGSTLSQWANDKIFSLGSPRRIATSDAENKPAAAFQASRAFDLGGGVLAAEIEVIGCLP